MIGTPGNETTTVRLKQPEVAAILDSAVNESGDRMYKIAWKTSWVNENNLTDYKHMIDEFCAKCHEKKSRAHKITDKSFTLPDERLAVYRHAETSKVFYRHHHNTHEKKCSGGGVVDMKRKIPFNLENIVSKLKKTKREESCNESDELSSRTSSNFINDQEICENKKNEKENDTIHQNNDKRTEREQSPMSSLDGDDDDDDSDDFVDVENVDEQKSSFMTELEQKDDESYMTTLTMTSSRQASHKSIEGVANGIRNSFNASRPCELAENPDKEMKPSSSLNPSDSQQLRKLLEEREHTGELDYDTHDKIDETRCEKCNKKFYRRSQLIRHLSNHVVHECYKCNAVFYCVRRYKRHLNTHESYPCDYCNEEFYDASAWYKHRAKHTMVECSSCDMVFYSRAALMKHKIFHMQYVCPICQSSFSDLNFWLPHRAYHDKYHGSRILTPIIKCRECHAGFSTQEAFTKHVCLFPKKSLDKKRVQFTKMEISDLIGVDQTSVRM